MKLRMFIILFIARSQSSKVYDKDLHIHLNFSSGAENRFESSVQNRGGRTTGLEADGSLGKSIHGLQFEYEAKETEVLNERGRIRCPQTEYNEWKRNEKEGNCRDQENCRWVKHGETIKTEDCYMHYCKNAGLRVFAGGRRTNLQPTLTQH